MDFSTEEERRVVDAHVSPAYEYTVTKLKGPCLVCQHEQIEYSRNWPSSEEHARKQFIPKRRSSLLHALRTGFDGNAPKVETIVGMVCPNCRAECEKSQEAAYRQKQADEAAESQKVKAKCIAHERHYEWWTATAAEVDATPHSAEFRAVFANFEVHDILFRWRAVPGKCRGTSFLTRVGMWVDGKLTAHYYGWNLQWLEDDDYRPFYVSEDNWPTSDLFGAGFCHWIERAFQGKLRCLKPDQSWRVGQFEELDSRIGKRPGLVLIEWLDGTRYVHLVPSLNLPEVAEWADKRLELRIEERAFRPVRGTVNRQEE
jgi:hypothetical protein